MSKKILVYGLGAIGTAFVTFLKEAGNTVYGKAKRKNFPLTTKVKGIWGEHKATLDGVSTDIEDFKNIDFDLIIVAVKAYDTENAIKDIKKLNNNSIVLLTQNGYGNYEIAKEYLGADRVLLSRVIFGSKVLKAGEVEITVNADDVVIGQPEGAIDENIVKEIVELIKSSGIPARYSPEVYKILWDKILYNSALNPLGAILSSTYGELASNSETREIMNNIIKEIFKVAKAHNIKLNWKSPEEYIEFFYSKLIPPTKEHYPSMYYDIRDGKKTEIDALNGAIVKLAEEKNIDVPVNKTIVNLLKFKEKNKK